jgi:hypothetical protein
VKTELWAPPAGPLDLGSWHTMQPGDDTGDWVGYFWHGVFVATQSPGLASAWFEVDR